MAPAVAVRTALEALVHSSSVTDARRSGTERLISAGIIDSLRFSSDANDDGPFPGMIVDRNPRVPAPFFTMRWFESSSARDWRA